MSILRNWVLHGYNFKTTVLLNPNEEGNFDVVDREDSFDWQKKFPLTRFNRIDELRATDAKLALRIVLDTLHKVVEASNSVFFITAYLEQPHSFLLDSSGSCIDDILEMNLNNKQSNKANSADAKSRAADKRR